MRPGETAQKDWEDESFELLSVFLVVRGDEVPTSNLALVMDDLLDRAGGSHLCFELFECCQHVLEWK